MAKGNDYLEIAKGYYSFSTSLPSIYLESALNQARRKIKRDFYLYERIKKNISANTKIVPLPPYLIFNRIQAEYNNLVWKLERLWKKVPLEDTFYGLPLYFRLELNQLVLYPIPNVDLTLWIELVKDLNLVYKSDNLHLNDPDIPDEYTIPVCILLAYNLALHDQQYELAAYFLETYYTMYQDFRKINNA